MFQEKEGNFIGRWRDGREGGEPRTRKLIKLMSIKGGKNEVKKMLGIHGACPGVEGAEKRKTKML